MKQKFVKLPNGSILPVSDNGFVTAVVTVCLADLMEKDSSGYLSHLSQEVTGTDVMSEMLYRIVGHSAYTVDVEVKGCINTLAQDQLEYIEADNLPQREFEVTVTRVGYGFRTFRMFAKTAAEAESIADDDAGSHLYSEKESEYQVAATEIKA